MGRGGNAPAIERPAVVTPARTRRHRFGQVIGESPLDRLEACAEIRVREVYVAEAVVAGLRAWTAPMLATHVGGVRVPAQVRAHRAASRGDRLRRGRPRCRRVRPGAASSPRRSVSRTRRDWCRCVLASAGRVRTDTPDNLANCLTVYRCIAFALRAREPGAPRHVRVKRFLQRPVFA